MGRENFLPGEKGRNKQKRQRKKKVAEGRLLALLSDTQKREKKMPTQAEEIKQAEADAEKRKAEAAEKARVRAAEKADRDKRLQSLLSEMETDEERQQAISAVTGSISDETEAAEAAEAALMALYAKGIIKIEERKGSDNRKRQYLSIVETEEKDGRAEKVETNLSDAGRLVSMLYAAAYSPYASTVFGATLAEECKLSPDLKNITVPFPLPKKTTMTAAALLSLRESISAYCEKVPLFAIMEVPKQGKKAITYTTYAVSTGADELRLTWKRFDVLMSWLLSGSEKGRKLCKALLRHETVKSWLLSVVEKAKETADETETAE
jgi:hypothetical protein